MAIEPINPAGFRPDLLSPRRQTFGTGQGAGPSAPGSAAAPATRALPNLQLQELIQTGRENSALLSTLPGPNLSFFQAPGPAGAGFPQGPLGGGAPGTRQLNVPLLETEQTGRVSSTLFSALMGPNRRAFQPPMPPVFAAPANGAGTTPGFTGAASTAALPPAGAPLLEAEQAGRTTSTLLSGLMGPGRPPAGSFGVSGYASGDALGAMRTAQDVLQAVSAGPPSAQDMRIANEAYRMEAQAQLDYTRGAGGPGNWEWFA